MKQAVCLLVISTKGNILGVSRRNDATKWGMPGGKVDPGEDVLQALQREVGEEIGIHVLKQNLIPLYADSEGDFWVSTFLYLNEIDEETEFDIEDGLTVRWFHPKEFLTLEPFLDYNEGVFRQFALSDITDIIHDSQPSN